MSQVLPPVLIIQNNTANVYNYFTAAFCFYTHASAYVTVSCVQYFNYNKDASQSALQFFHSTIKRQQQHLFHCFIYARAKLIALLYCLTNNYWIHTYNNMRLLCKL